MAYGYQMVTWSMTSRDWDVKLVTPVRLEHIISKTGTRVGYASDSLVSGLNYILGDKG